MCFLSLIYITLIALIVEIDLDVYYTDYLMPRSYCKLSLHAIQPYNLPGHFQTHKKMRREQKNLVMIYFR